MYGILIHESNVKPNTGQGPLSLLFGLWNYYYYYYFGIIIIIIAFGKHRINEEQK